MADAKISALSAVTTPAGSDEFAVNQGGTSKKETLAQIHTNDAHAGYSDYALIGAPANPASGVRFYGLSDDGVPRWEYRDAAGEVIRLARDQVLTVRNNTGSTLTKGDCVYISGANANKTRVTKAKADVDTTMPAIGLMLDTVTNGNDGRCMIGGIIAGLNTSAYTDGDPVYVSDATAGALTGTIPTYPSIKQRVGVVLSAHASTGSILVAPVGMRGDGIGGIRLLAIPNPAVPAADSLHWFARNIAGRMMPKWMPPSGVDTPVQPALFGNRVLTFGPNTGTIGTGIGIHSPLWTSNGTVSHPTPATTSPAISNQMKRTRYANVVTTQNQQLGPRYNAASEQQFWIGNAAGLGGFFFATRFIVELYPAATVRIFAGLTSTATGSVVISDTVLANTCGLWHSTTDPSSGANSFNFVTKNASTATKQSIALSNAIAAGNSYDFYMFCKPNDTTLYWRLDDLVNNVTYEGSTSTTLPVNTAFMQPQVQMSNGTANTTATTVAIGVAGIYVESDR